MDLRNPEQFEVQQNVQWIMQQSDTELKDAIQNYLEVLKATHGNMFQDDALVFNMMKEAAAIRGIKLDGMGWAATRAHGAVSEWSVTTTQHTPAESVPKSSSTDFILVWGETTPVVTFDIVAARERLATIKQELVEREASKKNYVGKSTTDFVENQVAIDRIKKEIQDLEWSIARAEQWASQDSHSKREEIGTNEDDLASLLPWEEAHLQESVRTKIRNLMTLDDAAFERSFQNARDNGWVDGKYEQEMYTSIQKVRGRTREELWQDIVAYNELIARLRKRQLESSNDPSGKPVSLDESSQRGKAKIIFARIASNYRLKNTPRDIAIAKDHNQFPTIIRDGTNRIKIVTPEWPIALPEGTKVLPPEAAKNPTDWARKAWGLGGLLLIGGILYACSGDDKNKTLTPMALINPTTPIAAPVTPEDACRDIGTPESTIDISRNNGKWDILTTQTRESITQRFMQSREFQTFKTFVQNNLASIQSKTACNDILGLLDTPNVANIQELQRRVNMDASDNKMGQDGILGPITLKKLQAYLEAELAK